MFITDVFLQDSYGHCLRQLYPASVILRRAGHESMEHHATRAKAFYMHRVGKTTSTVTTTHQMPPIN